MAEEERKLCLRLLREMCTNAVKYRLAWEIGEDFLVLWFVSAGRFPELAQLAHRQTIETWLTDFLPFTLGEQERAFLWA